MELTVPGTKVAAVPLIMWGMLLQSNFPHRASDFSWQNYASSEKTPPTFIGKEATLVPDTINSSTKRKGKKSMGMAAGIVSCWELITRTDYSDAKSYGNFSFIKKKETDCRKCTLQSFWIPMVFLFLPVLEELDAFWLQNGAFSLINAGRDFHGQNRFLHIFQHTMHSSPTDDTVICPG